MGIDRNAMLGALRDQEFREAFQHGTRQEVYDAVVDLIAEELVDVKKKLKSLSGVNKGAEELRSAFVQTFIDRVGPLAILHPRCPSLLTVDSVNAWVAEEADRIGHRATARKWARYAKITGYTAGGLGLVLAFTGLPGGSGLLKLAGVTLIGGITADWYFNNKDAFDEKLREMAQNLGRSPDALERMRRRAAFLTKGQS